MSSPTMASQILSGMQQGFLSDKAQGIDAVVQFELTGEGGGEYYMTIRMAPRRSHKARPRRRR